MSSILIAYERDQDVAAVETLLQSRGHRIVKARTGLEALEVARHDPPHAVVSDVLLPLLDGFALCRRLKEDPATRYLPVFLLSLRVEGAKYEAFAAEVGAHRFFPRGSTLEELAVAIESVKAGSDTMRIPALVPELLDRQEQDRRRVAELERQVRELQYTNKLLATAERVARGKVEKDARERADIVAAESDRTRELEKRIEELEQRERELAAAAETAQTRASELSATVEMAEARKHESTAELEQRARDLQQRIDEIAAGERERSSAESARAREMQQRIDALEARQTEFAEAESKVRSAAEESRAALARAGVLEARLAELQSSRARSQAAAADAERAFGALPVPTLLSDMETLEIRAASDSAAAMLAIAPHQLAGRSIADVLPGCSPADGGEPATEISLAKPDGSRAVLELRRTSVSYAGRACWLTALLDVTDERAADEARLAAQARVAALDCAPVAACIVNAEGKIEYANAAFHALTGIAAGKAEGQALAQVCVDEDAGPGVQDRTTAESRRARSKRPDGSVLEVEVTESESGDRAGGRIVTLRDVTDLRRAERSAARDQRVGEGLLELAQHTHTLTESEVPARALELAREVTGSECGYVFLATPEAGQLELAARSVSSGEAGQPLPVRWRGAAPAGTALAECVASQRLAEREAAEGTGNLRQAGLPGSLQRQLAVPIMDGGRLAGVLLLANRAEPFGADDRRHAARVADGLWKAVRRRRSDAEIVSAMDHMERVMLGTIEAIGALSEAQDGCRTGRSRRVSELAASIGTAMGLPGHAVRGLRVIGQLVDVGMLHIPREILWRTGPLGAAEFELVRTHVERGYETLRRIDFPWPVAEAVRQHHERLDGSGYPRALKGDEILLEARIVAVADAVEAMLSQRPQRQALSLTACLEELQTQAGRRYDAAAVRACVKLLRERHAQPEPEARAGQRIA